MNYSVYIKSISLDIKQHTPCQQLKVEAKTSCQLSLLPAHKFCHHIWFYV